VIKVGEGARLVVSQGRTAEIVGAVQKVNTVVAESHQRPAVTSESVVNSAIAKIEKPARMGPRRPDAAAARVLRR
jgi:hypothetical protein